MRDGLVQTITEDELLQYDASGDEPVLPTRIGTEEVTPGEVASNAAR